MSNRLYKAVWEYDAEGNRDTTGVEWDAESREPVGWEEYSWDKWGADVQDADDETWSHRPFFWPNLDKVFRSRSSAQYRVDIVNRWGGRAVLVECTPEWVSVELANMRRAEDRLQKRIDRKRAELNSLVDQRDLARLREQLTR